MLVAVGTSSLLSPVSTRRKWPNNVCYREYSPLAMGAASAISRFRRPSLRIGLLASIACVLVIVFLWGESELEAQTGSLRMAVLGDSYQSGEGLIKSSSSYECGTDLDRGLYFEGTNVPVTAPSYSSRYCFTIDGSPVSSAEWAQLPTTRAQVEYANTCHRSDTAAGVLASQTLGVAEDDLLFVPCSGAVIDDVTAKAHAPLSPPGVAGGRSQVDELRIFNAEAPVDVVTVGVGGNDIPFSGVIQRCLAPFTSCASLQYTSGISSVVAGLQTDVETLLSLTKSAAPNAQVFLIGYPKVVENTSISCIGLGIPPLNLNSSEATWIEETLIPDLNTMLQAAAANAGVRFIDIHDATDGNEICSSDPYINGIRPGSDIFGIGGNESFHPNENGHNAFAPVIAAEIQAATGPQMMCNGRPVTVDLSNGDVPTQGDDVIRGTSGADVINSLGGNDTICSLGGNDTINGGDGFDKVFAGNGADTITGGIGNDKLVGGAGNDSIRGGNGNDRIQGGDGADLLWGENGFDRVAGGNGNDTLRGGTSADELLGGLGRDALFGDEGKDVLRGGAWIDTMDGGPQTDGCTLTDPSGNIEVRISCETGVFGL
jgi:lysophospholipase L1-like esterase